MASAGGHNYVSVPKTKVMTMNWIGLTYSKSYSQQLKNEDSVWVDNDQFFELFTCILFLLLQGVQEKQSKFKGIFTGYTYCQIQCQMKVIQSLCKLSVHNSPTVCCTLLMYHIKYIDSYHELDMQVNFSNACLDR